MKNTICGLLVSISAVLLLISGLHAIAGNAGRQDDDDRLAKTGLYRHAADYNQPFDAQPRRKVIESLEKGHLTSVSSNRTDKARAVTSEHPVIERAPTWALIRAAEYHDGVNPPVIYWLSSTDNGSTWGNYTIFNVDNAQYPSLDYWGSGTTFYGTFVTPSSFLMGGGVILLEFEDAADSCTWAAWWSDFSDNGWHSMRMNDIAANNSQQSWNWGLISLVMSYTDPDTNIVDAPHIYSQVSSLGHVQLSWYPTIPGCRSTAVDIDSAAAKTYAVYDRLNPDKDQWHLFVRRDYFSDWFLPTDASFLYYADSTVNLINPDIVAHAGIVLIAAESYTDADSADKDIVCWRTSTGDVDDIAFQTVIAGSTDAETAPRISYFGGNRYVCTFVRDNKVYVTTSCDEGMTWQEPAITSDTALHSVSPEYRGTDLSGDAWRMIYQDEGGEVFWRDRGCNDADNDEVCDCDDNCPLNYNPSQGDTDGDSVGNTCDLCPGFDDTIDDDADGIPQACDNCPLVENSDQSDMDDDGIGDACDECSDRDGDGFGNPGYAASTCPDDNCPDSANVDQDDSDGDGIGDVCDNCPGDINTDQADADHDNIGDICDDCTDSDGDGYGDPGYPFNTCGLDNCPPLYNPDQADSNSDGIGDACDALICGDANFDGDINVADAIFIINFVFKGGPPPASFWAADPNGDGIVNVGDAVYLVEYIFKGGPDPACPQAIPFKEKVNRPERTPRPGRIN